MLHCAGDDFAFFALVPGDLPRYRAPTAVAVPARLAAPSPLPFTPRDWPPLRPRRSRRTLAAQRGAPRLSP